MEPAVAPLSVLLTNAAAAAGWAGWEIETGAHSQACTHHHHHHMSAPRARLSVREREKEGATLVWPDTACQESCLLTFSTPRRQILPARNLPGAAKYLRRTPGTAVFCTSTRLNRPRPGRGWLPTGWTLALSIPFCPRAAPVARRLTGYTQKCRMWLFPMLSRETPRRASPGRILAAHMHLYVRTSLPCRALAVLPVLLWWLVLLLQ